LESDCFLTADNRAPQEHVFDQLGASTFLRSMLDSSVDCIKVLDPSGIIQYINDGGVRLLSADSAEQLKGRNWLKRWSDSQEQAAAAALAEACAGRTGHFQGVAPDLRGAQKHWDVKLTPIRLQGEHDDIRFVLAITRDITDQRRAEQQRELLAAELDHRVKNILTVVSAIAHQTLRPPATLEKASELFVNRLSALSKAQAILTKSAWNGADMAMVVEGALAAYQDEGAETRFIVSGPPIDLAASKALSLALAIHELATNAMKYGSLSSVNGTVAISWSIGKSGDIPMLRFEWREQGGPPAQAPVARGFGSRLIERALAAEFRGKVQMDFAPEGLVCSLTAPLKSLAAN
jgi:PAS domain S-box-containing protein